MDYNPYGLFAVKIEGTEIFARPIELDSEIANDITMLNAEGGIVKPTKLSTVCPKCGHGMVLNTPFDILMATNPEEFVRILTAYEWSCERCSPPAPAPRDPFMNPVIDNRVGVHELDPLLHDPSKEIKPETATVAERLRKQGIEIEELTAEEPSGPSDEPQTAEEPKEPEAISKIEEKPKEGPSQPKEDAGSKEPKKEKVIRKQKGNIEMVDIELDEEMGKEELDDLIENEVVE